MLGSSNMMEAMGVTSATPGSLRRKLDGPEPDDLVGNLVGWSGLLPKGLFVGALSALVYRMTSLAGEIPVGVFVVDLNLYHLGGLVL